MKEDWDYLIILDACRFDYFKEIYRNFFKRGVLRKAISPFTQTMEYLRGTYGNFYDDIIYVSSNPFINSRVETKRYGIRFDGKKHFYKIIDVWDWGWSERFGVVHPKTVNQSAIKTKRIYPDKRLVIHYMQPHIPFLSVKDVKEVSDIWLTSAEGRVKRTREKKKSFLWKLVTTEVFNYFIDIIKFLRINFKNRILNSDEAMWKIEKFFGLPPNIWRKYYRKLGPEGTRRAYKNNLRLVLWYVSELSDFLPGKYLITSDHGEMLGEGGRWGHEYPYSKCLEIPWFTIKTKNKEFQK